MSRTLTPTIAEVLYEIEGFDTRLQSYDAANVSPQVVFHAENAAAHQVFYTDNNNSRGRGSYGNRSGSNRGRCGFTSRGRGFHQQTVNTGQTSQSNSSNTRPTCQIYSRVGYTALKCWNRFDNNYQSDDLPQALAALHVSDSSGREWHPDSAATAHVTPAPLLSNLQLLTTVWIQSC